MKQPYRWDYTIRIKKKEGTYEYEDKLENVDNILEKHPNYEEIQAKHIIRCDKCNIELKEPFIQEGRYRTYKLCKTCNDRYLSYMENVKKLRRSNNKSLK